MMLNTMEASAMHLLIVMVELILKLVVVQIKSYQTVIMKATMKKKKLL